MNEVIETNESENVVMSNIILDIIQTIKDNL